MDKYLISGGVGFIGSNFTKKALDLGHEVTVIDNLSTGKKENLDKRAKFVKMDLEKNDVKAELKLVEILKNIDYIFHFAALPRVQFSVEHPITSHMHNTIPLLKLLHSTNGTNVKRLIYSASSSAYGDLHPMPLKEDMMPNPLSPYAAQKYMGELYCKMWYNLFGLETVSLRYFNVYAQGMSFKGSYKPVIASFIENVNDGKDMVIYGDGEQTRDFTHVDDVVRANLLAAESSKVGKGEVINIGAGNSISINKVASYFNAGIDYQPARKGDVKNTLADISKAWELLGWKPQVSFDEGMEQCLELYLKRKFYYSTSSSSSSSSSSTTTTRLYEDNLTILEAIKKIFKIK